MLTWYQWSSWLCKWASYAYKRRQLGLSATALWVALKCRWGRTHLPFLANKYTSGNNNIPLNTWLCMLLYVCLPFLPHSSLLPFLPPLLPHSSLDSSLGLGKLFLKLHPLFYCPKFTILQVYNVTHDVNCIHEAQFTKTVWTEQSTWNTIYKNQHVFI